MSDQPLDGKPPKKPIVSDRITSEEAKNALLRSGYLLEYRVESLLRKYGMSVQANAPYLDPATKVVREIDVEATMPLATDTDDSLGAHFLIECKNLAQPLAFITRPSTLRRYSKDVKLEIYAGLRDYDNFAAFKHRLRFDEFHYYAKGRTATQYCSFQRKKDKGEWFALHPDDQHNLHQSLVAAYEDVARRDDFLDSVTNWFWATQFFLVAVVQGEIWDLRPRGKCKVEIKPTQHVKYRMSRLKGNFEIGYLVDVVTESYLPAYLDKALKCFKTTSKRLLENREGLLAYRDNFLPRSAESAANTPEQVTNIESGGDSEG